MANTLLHLAIIPDGNRRWATKRALQPWKGHEQSAETFEALLTWCGNDERIGTLTMWFFSTENWKRDQKEVEKLMDMFEKYLREKAQMFHDNKIRVLHSGRKDRLRPEFLQELEGLIEATKDYDALTLNLAIDYGGHDELQRAAERAVEHNRELSTINFQLSTFLDNPDLPNMDLVIRTSGEQRTSGFFPWQTCYAEWMFIDKLFPDFTTEDLEGAIDDFGKRNRRFGT